MRIEEPTMTFRDHARELLHEYGKALLVAAVAGILAGFAWLGFHHGGTERVEVPALTPAAFAPLTSRGITFVTPGPYHAGQTVTILNGFCNESKDVQQVITIVGFEEQRVERLLARNVTVSPLRAELGGQPLPRPFDPGCVADKEPIIGPLPLNLPPGYWKLYVAMTVMGPVSGQVQRLTIQSSEIEVVP